MGGGAFLSNPYPNLNVTPCADGLWYWELQDLFVRRCQLSLGSGTCTDYPDSGGMPITTRFVQYDNPTQYGAPDTIPDCAEDRAGERVASYEVVGVTAQSLFIRRYVCNRAAEIAPISLPDLTLQVGQTGVVGQLTVSGLPHSGTEALIAGRDYIATGPATEAVPRLFRNGTAGSAYHRAIPMGHITPTSPSLALFNATYGTVRDGVGVPVMNGDVVRVEVTAPSTPGVYPMFVKLGDRVARFNLTAEIPVIATVYDVGTCAIAASGNLDQQTATACGPEYVASTSTPVNLQNGTCPAIGDARLHRIINQNAAASFWHGYLCQEAPPGRPGHVYLGEFQSTSAQLRDLLVGGTLHVVSNTVTMNGLSGEAVLTWAHGGNARGSAIRINKGPWVTSPSADPALRQVRNGDQVELAIRTGGGTASSRNWAILTMTSVTNPSLSLRRDFAVTGDRTVSTSPYPEPPLTSGGAISSNSAYHPVFSLFQSCFGVGPGAHLSFPGACTMDAAFWDRFYTEACKASPYSLSISMGGLNLASSGSACAVTGFEAFQSRARVSTCVPDSCAIGEGGNPAACVFSCGD